MRSQTFNIALPRLLVQKIDRVAQKQYYNRSELIRAALTAYLKDIEEWEQIMAYGAKQAAKVGVKNEEDVNRIVAEFRHGKKAARQGRPRH